MVNKRIRHVDSVIIKIMVNEIRVFVSKNQKLKKKNHPSNKKKNRIILLCAKKQSD